MYPTSQQIALIYLLPVLLAAKLDFKILHRILTILKRSMNPFSWCQSMVLRENCSLLLAATNYPFNYQSTFLGMHDELT